MPTLYHFTSKWHYFGGKMAETGIRGGTVDWLLAAVPGQWLTDDPESYNQKWSTYGALDKTEVRLTVNIPDHHPRLVRWDDFCVEYGVPEWASESLNETGGPEGASDHWWLYLGDIPAEWITKAEEKAVYSQTR